MRLRYCIRIGVLSIVAACLFSCSGRKKAAAEEGPACRTFKLENGYGYAILYGKDTVIYQPFIPALSGMKPFVTEEDAMKIGQMVRSKLMNNDIPSLTVEEIRASGITIK